MTQHREAERRECFFLVGLGLDDVVDGVEHGIYSDVRHVHLVLEVVDERVLARESSSQLGLLVRVAAQVAAVRLGVVVVAVDEELAEVDSDVVMRVVYACGHEDRLNVLRVGLCDAQLALKDIGQTLTLGGGKLRLVELFQVLLVVVATKDVHVGIVAEKIKS